MADVALNKAIADALKAMRKDRDYSQTHVAASLGVTPQAVNNWERGRRLPRYAELQALGALYETPVRDFWPTDADIETARKTLQKENDEQDEEQDEGPDGGGDGRHIR